MRSYSVDLHHNFATMVALLSVATILLFLFHLFFMEPTYIRAVAPYALALGLTACPLILLVFPHINLLAAIGRRSFTIYLFHPIVFAVANRVVHDPYMLTAIGLVLGIAGPIIFEWVVEKRVPLLKPLIGQRLR